VTGTSGRLRSAQTAAELADDLAELGPVTLGRFFGGTGLRLEEVQFGFVLKSSVYLRVDDATRPAFEQFGGRPFQYQSNGRTVTVSSYYAVPDTVSEDHAKFVDLARQGHQVGRAARSSAKSRT
jgi:DNA transformation protein